MFSDVTENKKMEAVIEAANLTENLGYVFSGIRHEIGNPLNSIKMALSVLQRNIEEYDLDTTAQFLDRSLHEISRIEYLLTSLKNYSLFEKPLIQPINLPEFLRNFVTLVRNDFERKTIQIRLIISADDLVISADSRALHHVLLNIFTNAADALEKIEQPQITVSCARAGAVVEIKIDDNGKGISEEEYQHLFKPFFTSKTYGTGLGLVIVKKMLTVMQGQIHLESYKGLGTTVTIRLPEYNDEPITQDPTDN
jgi:signal transduction histidine kinase